MIALRTLLWTWAAGGVLAVQVIACDGGVPSPVDRGRAGAPGLAGTTGGVNGVAGNAGSAGVAGAIDAGAGLGGTGGAGGGTGMAGSAGFAGAGISGTSGAAGAVGAGAGGSGTAGFAGNAGASAGSGGAGGAAGMAGSGPLSHAKDIQPIWDASCVTHCHSRDPQTVPDAGLELWPDGYPAIINVPSKQSALVLVKPGSLTESYLWRKLDNTWVAVGGSGETMPFGTTLPQAELAKIRQWILDGAAP